jgi:hypothetical protein
MVMQYLQLEPGSNPPDISALKPFRTVVIVDDKPTSEWQAQVSEWLVRSGCLYMMAWGKECSSWDDSVDSANLEEFDFGDIPEDKFVMTTWHENDSLRDVFWFSKNNAFHPTVELQNTVILHISWNNREKELLAGHAGA